RERDVIVVAYAPGDSGADRGRVRFQPGHQVLAALQAGVRLDGEADVLGGELRDRQHVARPDRAAPRDVVAEQRGRDDPYVVGVAGMLVEIGHAHHDPRARLVDYVHGRLHQPLLLDDLDQEP